MLVQKVTVKCNIAAQTDQTLDSLNHTHSIPATSCIKFYFGKQHSQISIWMIGTYDDMYLM